MKKENTHSRLEKLSGIIKLNSGEFAFLAAHQLKTPLTALRWYVGDLLNQDHSNMTKQQSETLEELRSTVEQMADMINSLLKIGRIRSGRLNVEPAPVDSLLSVKDVILGFDSELHRRKMQISVSSTPKSLPMVNMDKDILRHVLQNVIDNAVRYSKDGSKVDISVKKEGQNLVFAVKDKGIGIPEKDQKRIFQEFFRARNAASFQPRGTGLGLALAKYLVRHWKGKIWFASAENKGSTFFFTLPIKGVKAQKGEVSLGA